MGFYLRPHARVDVGSSRCTLEAGWQFNTTVVRDLQIEINTLVTHVEHTHSVIHAVSNRS